MKSFCTVRATLACLSLVSTSALSAPTDDHSQSGQSVQREFVAAMQRIRQHEPEPKDSPALEAYVIHDYLVAARLQRDLAASPGDALDTAIDGFVRMRSSQPVSRALRHDWLASLAQRKRWDWFLPRSNDVTDAQLACDRLAGRLATGDTLTLSADALTRWNLPQKQPDECNDVFTWLRAQGVLTPELAEARARAALAADNPRLARDFIADVPAPRRAPWLQWLELLDTPKPALNALAGNTAPVEPDALVAGFSKLAVSDTALAATLLPLLEKRADATAVTNARLQRAAALGAAYSRAPNAVASFGGVAADPGDTAVQEWRVRAALWSGDYASALRWIDAMPAALGSQPRWRYWRARATAETAGPASALPLYADIAGMRDYYGYLAADKLSQNYNLNMRPSPSDAAAQAMLAAEPAMQRAHALFECDQIDDAAAEWAQVVGGAKAAVKIQAAHLASSWTWYSQTIATLAQAGEWDDVVLRYPRPYADLVERASKQTQVPTDWLFAVMRQESLFRKDAQSRADARGLMQMQPATASAVARRWHLPTPTRDSLFDPAVAVTLGAAYLKELLDKYPGQLDQSLAAYNAGPVAVARWLPPEPMDADVWIENIPYTETRGYVQHILEHIVAFAVMRDTTPPRLSTVLPKVLPAAPRGS